MKSALPKGHLNAAQNFHNGTSNNVNNNSANGNDKAALNVPFLTNTVFDFDSAVVSGTADDGSQIYAQGDFQATDRQMFNFGATNLQDFDNDGDTEYTSAEYGDLYIERVDGDRFAFVDVKIEDYDGDGAGSFTITSGDGLYTLTGQSTSSTDDWTFTGIRVVNGFTQTLSSSFEQAFDWAFGGQDVDQLKVQAFGVALDDFVFA